MTKEFFEFIKVILEIAGLVFLPITLYLIKMVLNHSQKIQLLEEKVNAELHRRLDVVERKIDTFDNKIEQKFDKLDNKIDEKIDKLDENLNSKIDLITDVLSSYVNGSKS